MASWVCTVCDGVNADCDACALCEQPRADAPAAAAPPAFDFSSLSLSAPPSQAVEDPDSLEFALRKIRELEASEALAARLAGAGDPAAPPVRRAAAPLLLPGGALRAGGAPTAPAQPQNSGGGGPTLLDVFGVLAPPAGAHGVCEGIFGFLTTRDARALRLVCHMCCADVAAARWHDGRRTYRAPSRLGARASRTRARQTWRGGRTSGTRTLRASRA